MAQALGHTACSTCGMEFQDKDMREDQLGMPQCFKHYKHRPGCFDEGTMLMRQVADGFSEVTIDTIRLGDKVLAIDDMGMVSVETVIFFDTFSPSNRLLTKITLASGKSVTTTEHHNMCVWTANGLDLKRADSV